MKIKKVDNCEIYFIVKGDPVPAARPRVVRNKYTNKIHTYIPKNCIDWKNNIISQCKDLAPEFITDKAIAMGILIFKKVPKSFSKNKQLLINNGLLRPITKPDTDNYIKLIKDSLNGIFYKDDSQVVEYIPIHGLYTGKYYTLNNPHIEVLIKYL